MKQPNRSKESMKVKSYLILLMTIVVGGFTMNACDLDDNDDYIQPPAAFVQFINAYPYATALGFRMDQSVINNEPIPYGQYIPYNYYTPFYVGERNFTAGISGTEQAIVDTTVTLEDSAQYTAVVYGVNDTAASIFVKDEQPADFDQSKAYVRFFNLAAEAPTMDVNLINNGTATEIFSNRAPDNATSATANQGFIAVDPGVYTIQFTDAAGTELARRNQAEEFAQGRFYTILSRGITGATENPLAVGYLRH